MYLRGVLHELLFTPVTISVSVGVRDMHMCVIRCTDVSCPPYGILVTCNYLVRLKYHGITVSTEVANVRAGLFMIILCNS